MLREKALVIEKLKSGWEWVLGRLTDVFHFHPSGGEFFIYCYSHKNWYPTLQRLLTYYIK
jgi:hypothetical protein